MQRRLLLADTSATLGVMPDIVLATLNAKYIHSSFGLRYLLANLGKLRERACIAEFQINQAPLEIVEAVLAHEPRIVGFGVYIWNVVETTEVLGMLRRLRPEIRIVLGGPEVSYEWEGQPIVALADHVITGEADLKFAEVCGVLLGEDAAAQAAMPKVMTGGLPTLEKVVLPYELYTESDLAHRILYVEASRGCPFTCEFCLSSLDVPVRAFALESFLAAMQGLLDRGALTFKFVDRTFNLHLPTSMAILRFFLDRWRDGMFLHFEMVPDRLPEQLRGIIREFPAGAVQFEVGIQTFDEATSKNISRRQNLTRLEDNLSFLRDQTGIHVHADLIVGLPGEDVASFGRGFDRLVKMGPQEIQVGILKRLRGTPIVRHDAEFEMKYSPVPPYEMLENRDIPFVEMQRMRRFARYWDLVANSGNFTATLALLWQQGDSPFVAFMAFAESLYKKLKRTHQIALPVLAQALFDYLTQECGVPLELAASTMMQDWNRVPGRESLRLSGAQTERDAPKRSAAAAGRRGMQWREGDAVFLKMNPAEITPTSRIKVVGSFEELVMTPWCDGINALCWQRTVAGDFGEIVEKLGVGKGITSIDEERLLALELSDAGQVAREVLLQDLERLRSHELLPSLDCINGYVNEIGSELLRTDVQSWHVDSATVEADTYLCTYFGAASEGLCNEEAVRRVDVPELRAELLQLYGGADDESFRGYLNENYLDLHYKPLPHARPFSFGMGHLWRIATEYPGSPVPPCVHRAPETQPGQLPRLLLIS